MPGNVLERLGFEVFTKGFRQFNRDVDQAGDKIEDLNKQMESSKRPARTFWTALDSADQTLESVGNTAGRMGTALTAGVTLPLVAVAGKSVSTAMQVQRLESSLAGLAGGADRASEYITAVQNASAGTIPKLVAMQVSARAMTLGVADSADKMERLTRVAITLGRAQGLTAQRAVEDLTVALGRQSPMILDNLGITMKLSEAYARYAERLGVTEKELTDVQKREAFVIEALNKGEAVAKRIGMAHGDAATQTESLQAALEDASIELGEVLIPYVIKGTKAATDFAREIIDMEDATRKWVFRIGAVAIAAGPALKGVQLLTIAGRGLISFLPDAILGFNALASGISLAEISAVSASATIGALAVPITTVGTIAGGQYHVWRRWWESINLVNDALKEAGTREEDLEVLRQAATKSNKAFEQWVTMQDAVRNASELGEGQLSDYAAMQAEVDRQARKRGLEAYAARLQGAADAAENTAYKLTEAYEANEAYLGSIEILNQVMAGPVTEQNESYIAEREKISQQMAEAQAQIDELVSKQGYYAGSQENIILAQAEVASSADRITEAQKKLQQAQSEGAENLIEYEAQVVRAEQAHRSNLQALEASKGGYVDNSEEIAAIQEDMAGYQESLRELEATHREKTKQIIFQMLQARLATDGWTEEETELAWTAAESMGLIDSATADAVRNVNKSLSEWEAGAKGTNDVITDLYKTVDEAATVGDKHAEAVEGQTEAAQQQAKQLLLAKQGVEEADFQVRRYSDAVNIARGSQIEEAATTSELRDRTDELRGVTADATEESEEYTETLDGLEESAGYVRDTIEETTGVTEGYTNQAGLLNDEIEAGTGFFETYIEKLIEGAEKQGEWSEEVTDYRDDLEDVHGWLKQVKTDIENLPEEHIITVRYKYVGSPYHDYDYSYQEGTPFVPRTGMYMLHRGEAVIPADQAGVYRSQTNIFNSEYNLTTQSVTRPGGLRLEFEAMEALDTR